MLLKIVALLSGLLASAFAWAATYLVADISAQFLALWPPTNSQQLLGLVAWHGMVAAALLGGLIAVLSPLLGGIVLLGAVGAWVAIGLTLPVGFAPQVVIPMAFAGIGVIAAFGAIARGLLRRPTAQRAPSLEDMAREDALRLDPDVDLQYAVERKSDRGDDLERGGPSSSQPDAIQIAVRRGSEASVPYGLSGLFVANVTMLLLLTVAVGLLFYTNIRSGQLAAAFGTLPLASATTMPAAEAPAPETGTEVPAVAATETPAAPAVTPEVPQAEVQVSSAPLDLAALPPSNWADPFAYCAAVKTIDFPDRRYIGPTITEDIASALKVPVSSSPDRVKWRCYDGAVLGCASFRGASCALTPTLAEMRDYCAEHPNATDLQAPNGTWACIETTPEIPQGASWPVDPRGFLPGAWVEITAPGKPVSAG
jgi:hypothetical protein